ncbi:MAG: hypothetical protein GY852_11345 [bacterium]|nr:hypothetical protein [bacterium]
MALTRPAAHATRESGGPMPIPRTSRQHMPPRNVRRGAEFSSGKAFERNVTATKSELSALTVVNTRKNGSKLPSSPNEDSREIALPTFDEAIVHIENGNDAETIWAVRNAIPKLLEFLNKQDLWDLIDALSIGALDEKEKKGPEVRAACLDLMVIVHKKIVKKSLNGNNTSGIVVKGRAEIDAGAQAALPLLDARAISEAIEENVTDHSMGLDVDFLESEDRMAIAVVSLMESKDSWIGGAAERASCEIDSPLLMQALSGKVVVENPIGEVVKGVKEAEGVRELKAAFAPVDDKVLKANELWRLMDGLTTLAEDRERDERVRAAAFGYMIPVYDVISKFGSKGRDGGEIERKMTIAIIKAALGTDVEEKVSDAAMQAVEEIDSPVLNGAWESGRIAGETTVEEKGIDNTLESTALDVELAKIISVLDAAS